MSKPFAFPKWAMVPGLMSGLLLLLSVLYLQRESLTGSFQVSASTVELVEPADAVASGLGPRHQLTYEQWVQLLGREAAAIAQKAPGSLNVLAGDSLSLWFPNELLPKEGVWLNQGISGETSYGLLRRLKLFDRTNPRIIFLMIGINDLIQGVREETLVANHREIIRHLKVAHPQARIVVQSILPHGGNRASQRYLASIKDDPAAEQNPRPLWVDRLPLIPNQRIRQLNQRLETVAYQEKVEFLDLHDLFTDNQGHLQDELTTDGLHLSNQGYALWRSLLEQKMSTTAKNAAFP